MPWFDDDGSPVETYDDAVAESTAAEDDPAEEEAVDPLAEAHIEAMRGAQAEAARTPDDGIGGEWDYDILTGHSTRSAILRLHERLQGSWRAIGALQEHVARLSDRLERLEADLGVDDEFGDRPLPLDTPDIATVRREPGNEPRHEPFEQAQDREDARALAARGEAALAEPESLEEINRRARAEAEALREQDLAEGQGLAGVPEMVPAPLDDDMTAHDGFR